MRVEIDRLELAFFTESFYTNEFTYSEVEGEADCLGWYIIFFKEKGANEVSAISLEDIFVSESVIDIANKVLENIIFPVRFRDSFTLIKEKFGEPNFTSYILENVSRYYYIYKKEGLLLCFNIDNKEKLCGLEIISNKNIIKNRLEVLEE